MKWTPEQERAIYEHGNNILVSASAGSGKTAVLSERVKQNILNRGMKVNEMLVLTFTEASAAEMKERIKAVLKDDKENYDLVDSSYISTIDAFSMSLVKKYHYLLNISNNIKITDEVFFIYYKERFLREIFDKYYLEKNEIFLELLAHLTKKTDDALFNLILNLDNSANKLLDKTSFFKNYSGSDVVKFKEMANLAYKNKKEAFIQDLYELRNLAFEKQIEYLDSYIPFIEEGNFNDYKPVRTPNGYDEDYKKLNETIKKEALSLKSLYDFINGEVDQLLEESNKYSKFISKMLFELNERMEEFKRENELYDFSDISRLAIKLISENEYVRLELKNSFKEIMLDEYQDTNDIQEKLISLISNHNVYQVGDIKQSIYRFRNANPKLFKSKYDTYRGEEGIKIDLKENFRSRKEVVEAVNECFNLCFTEEKGEANYAKDHQMIYGFKLYDELELNYPNTFEVLNYTYEKKDEEGNPNQYKPFEVETFAVAYDIKERIKNQELVYDKKINGLRPCKFSDFTILAETGSDFYEIKKIFSYFDIPLRLTKDEDIKSGYFLTVVTNLFKLINAIYLNKTNEVKYYLTSILRSYLYQESDETIYHLIKSEDYLYTKHSAYVTASNIARKVDTLSVIDLFDLTIKEFDPLAKASITTDINSEQAKLDFITNMASASFSFSDFIEILEEIKLGNIKAVFNLNEEQQDSVLLSTIHKSKGLEYPFVYLIEMFKKFKSDNASKICLYDNEILVDAKDRLLPIKDLINEEEFNATLSEKIRLLYVAFTRAREKLILVDTIDYENKDKWDNFHKVMNASYAGMKMMVTNVDPKLNKLYKLTKEQNLDVKKEDQIMMKDLVINKELVNKKTYSKDTKFKLFSKEEQNLLDYGTKLHEEFEKEDFKNPCSTNPKVKAFYDTSIMKDINNAKIYKEYQFIDDQGVTGIIDLMIEKENEIDIVDYKTKNIDDDAYYLQLNAYKSYVSLKTNKKIRIFLYSIMDEILKEL